jgi:hypothetical protein
MVLVAASRMLRSTRCGVHDQLNPRSIASLDNEAIVAASHDLARVIS